MFTELLGTKKSLFYAARSRTTSNHLPFLGLLLYFLQIHLSLTKLIIKSIIPTLDNAGAHRVEAQSIAGYKSVHNWLKFLGLEEESVLRGYGRNGEDFINFSYAGF